MIYYQFKYYISLCMIYDYYDSLKSTKHNNGVYIELISQLNSSLQILTILIIGKFNFQSYNRYDL